MTDRTPVTRKGMKSYDHLPVVEAIRQAWSEPGAQPGYHERMKTQVRAQMPLLARALDRLDTRK